ncbi:MAG: hypothetical protein ACYC3I_12465 [Gemmataceae bacterium]
MYTKLFIVSALAVVLAVADLAFAGAATKAKPTVAPETVKTAQGNTGGQPCCDPDECCPECCSLDDCCEECIECCIEMGCDPSCCFPALTSTKLKAPQKSEVCCTNPAKKAVKSCCGDGCCK